MAFGRTSSLDYDGTGDYQDSASDDSGMKRDENFERGKTKDDGGVNAGYRGFGKKEDDSYGLLKKGEKDASENPNSAGRGGDKKSSLGEKENNVKSDKDGEIDGLGSGKFNNAVQGVKELMRGNKIKAGRRFRKSGPVMMIAAILIGFAGASFFGQMTMPFSLVSQFQEAFDSIKVSQNIRSKTFLKMKMNKNVKGCIKAHYFRPNEFKVSKRQESKLEKSGITFNKDKSLMYYKGMEIVADDTQASNGRMSFNQLYESDADFHRDYNNGSRTWRGAVGAWFDTHMPAFLKKFSIRSRNKFKNFEADTDESQEKFKKQVSDDVESDGLNGSAKKNDLSDQTTEEKTTVVDEKTNEETTTTTTKQEVINDESNEAVSIRPEDAKSGTLRSKISNAISAVATSASSVANIYCAVQDAIAAVSAIAAAAQALQVLELASNLLEGIQKAQAGDGSAAPLHETANSLTQPARQTYDEVDHLEKSGSGDSEEWNAKTKTVEYEGSAMEAEIISATYGGYAANPNDPSLKSFNYQNMTKTMYTQMGSNTSGPLGSLLGLAGSVAANVSTGAAAFRSCSQAKLAASVASAAITAGKLIFEAASCIATAGIGCVVSAGKALAKKVWNWIWNAAKKAILSIVISSIASMALPFIANILLRGTMKDVLVGKDLGNGFGSGAHKYMASNHQFTGGGVASKSSYMAYIKERDAVIADEARYERESRSPFDVTSKYTFLGSLAAQMVPIASQMSSITGALRGVTTVVGNAVTSLMPEAGAVTAAVEAQVQSNITEEYCPDIAEIGGVADSFCNPYIITDVTTLKKDPSTVVNKVDSLGVERVPDPETGELKEKDQEFYNLKDVPEGEEDNAVPEIGKKSELAKYIIYCGQRNSPFGMADQNIASEVSTPGGIVGTSVGQAVVGSLGLIGDAFDIAENKSKLDNMGWISGESCVVGNNDKESVGSKAITWETAKEYQRFVEDQRLAEAEGLTEQSAVSKLLAEYYEEHPIDYSYEGILARFSGLTKENVIATLNIIEVADFLADYRPAHMYPYPLQDEGDVKIEIIENNTINNVMIATLQDNNDNYTLRRQFYYSI